MNQVSPLARCKHFTELAGLARKVAKLEPVVCIKPCLALLQLAVCRDANRTWSAA